jgi:hypothetical protein
VKPTLNLRVRRSLGTVRGTRRAEAPGNFLRRRIRMVSDDLDEAYAQFGRFFRDGVGGNISQLRGTDPLANVN